MGAAAGSGVLVAVAFPPFDLGLIVFVELIPLLWAWRGRRPMGAAVLGLVFGVVAYGAIVSWVFYFGVVAIVPLVLAFGGITAAIGALDAWLRARGVRSAWILAAIWMLFEFARGRAPLGGLPWGELGVALHNVPAARALATWGGVPLVTFAVVAVNALLLDLILGLAHGRVTSVVRAAGGVVFVVALALVADATWTVGPAGETLRIASLQGNDQNRELTKQERKDRFLPRSHFALADTLSGEYDLIIFPESSFDKDPARDRYLRREIQRIAEEHDAYLLLNAPVPSGDGRDYNANVLYDPDGMRLDYYAKRHLVPFGEYVPLRRFLDWIPAIDQVPYDYKPGNEAVVFDVGGTPIGTVICFENAFSNLTRGVVRDGAEILVVSTNNRSYRRSGNAAQHVAISQMRAAETGRPIVHSAISGITAIVDPWGRVTQETELFELDTVTAEVTARRGQTLYVRFGDWAVAVGAAATLAAVLVAWRRGRAPLAPVIDSPDQGGG